MHKVLYFIIFLALNLNFISAQDEDRESLPRYEIGFNASSIIHNTLGTGDNAINYPFDFLFNCRAANSDLYLRTGFSFSGRTESDDDKKTSQRFFNLRVGLSKGFDIKEKFGVALGFDVLFSNNNSTSEPNNNNRFDSSSSALSFGLGPAMVLSYQLSKRVSLRTESSLYFISTNESFDFDTVNGGNKSEQSSSSLDLNVPLNILVFVNF